MLSGLSDNNCQFENKINKKLSDTFFKGKEENGKSKKKLTFQCATNRSSLLVGVLAQDVTNLKWNF